MILLLIAYVLLAPARQAEAVQRCVVRVWNVDTFEGGRGSRTAFLKRAAQRVSEAKEGIYYLVSSYTQEGAAAALAAGDFPDMISFGIGLAGVLDYAQPLPYSFAGGIVSAQSLAVPWYRGGYMLFSLTDDFSAEGDTAISVGGSNLSAVAAALAGVTGTEAESLTAYTKFLRGEYRYLLGTQRDLARLQSRGVSFYMQTLPQFSDLYGYLSILSADHEAACLMLVRELLSDQTQTALSEIGMYSPYRSDALPTAEYTTSVFLSETAEEELCMLARSGDIKSMQKYLRTI